MKPEVDMNLVDGQSPDKRQMNDSPRVAQFRVLFDDNYNPLLSYALRRVVSFGVPPVSRTPR